VSAETYLSLFDLVVISTTITITITTTTHNQYRAIRLIIHASVLSLSIHSFIHVTHSRHSRHSFLLYHFMPPVCNVHKRKQ